MRAAAAVRVRLSLNLLLLMAGGCGRVGYEPIVPANPIDGSVAIDAPVTGSDGVVVVPLDGAPPRTDTQGGSSDAAAIKADGALFPIDLAFFLPDLPIALPDLPSVRLDVAKLDQAGPDTGSTAMWGPPQLIPALSDRDDDWEPTVTGDLLELYFRSERENRPAQGDIWVSKRASPNDPWGAPSRVTALSTLAGENSPEVSADGLTIWFTSERSNTGLDIWVSTRADRSAAWTNPVRAADLSTNGNDEASAPNLNLTRIVLHSDRPNRNEYDIFEAVRASTSAPWSTAVPLAGINTTAFEAAPFLSSDDLTIYFVSDRGGGVGNFDLYQATRPNVSSPFAPPTRIQELNSIDHDSSPWVSADGRLMLFNSDRSGNHEIYEAHRL
jgi:hypothetical protein